MWKCKKCGGEMLGAVTIYAGIKQSRDFDGIELNKDGNTVVPSEMFDSVIDDVAESHKPSYYGFNEHLYHCTNCQNAAYVNETRLIDIAEWEDDEQ